MENSSNRQNMLNSQRIIILILAVALLMVLVTGVTFAWYTRLISDKLGITLSNPVEIYITDHMGVPQGGSIEIKPEDTIILPGTKINLKLGFVMGKTDQPSSPAYVRVKLKISSDALVGEGGDIITEGLVEFNTVPISTDWVEVDFGEEGKWWVFSQNNDDNVLAKIAYNQEEHRFIDGQIKISTALTNIFANQKIFLEYTVSAIQSQNVENPLLNRSNPTWGKLLEN